MFRYSKTAKGLLRVLARHDRLLVLTHENPDPDSIASGAALSYIAATSLGIPTTLAYTGIIGRAENKAMVEVLGLELVPFNHSMLAPGQAVAVTDTQPEAGNLALPPAVVPTVVVDHHPITAALTQVPFADVRPWFGATSTILAHYFFELRMPIPARLATALFYGIKTDTQDLSRHTCEADRQAYLYLMRLVDTDALPKIEYPRLQKGYFETFRMALERAFIFDDVIISHLDQMSNPNAVAEVADLLLRLEGMTWSLGLGFYGDYLFVSLRTNDPELNAGVVVQKAMRGLGSSGGHGVMAAGKAHLTKATPETRRKLVAEVEDRFLAVLGSQRKGRQKLLSVKPRKTAKRRTGNPADVGRIAGEIQGRSAEIRHLA